MSMNLFYFFQSHHSIFDGLSILRNFFQFLVIIQNKYAGRDLDLKPVELFQGVDTLFADEKKTPFKRTEIPHMAKPSFIDSKRAVQNCGSRILKYVDDQTKRNFSILDVEKKHTFISLEELFDFSKTNHLKVKRSIIAEKLPDHLKFYEKCKKENVKMTTFYNLVFCYAFKKLYANNNEPLTHIVYYNQISLQQFKPYAVDENFLGYCVGGLFSQVAERKLKLKFNGKIDLYEFWRLAKAGSDQMTDRVKQSPEKFSPMMFDTQNPSKMLNNIHFFLSNLKQTYLPNIDPLKIDSWLSMSSLDPRLSELLMTIMIGDVNNHSNIEYLYNSHFIDNFLIDEIDNFAFDILNEILDSC